MRDGISPGAGVLDRLALTVERDVADLRPHIEARAKASERDAIAGRSPQGKHIVVPDSGHWIHLDQPQVVIDTIREMVELVRTR